MVVKILVLVMSIVVVSCDSVNPDESNKADVIFVEAIRFFDFPNDSFIIDSAYVVMDYLVIQVHYSGGCKDHDFQLIFENSFQESDSISIRGFLSHNANGDMCEAWIGDELKFNLLPIKEFFFNEYGSSASWPDKIIRISLSNYSKFFYYKF